MAGVPRRNAAKMGGRTLETTNAPVLGEKSVAEQSGVDAEAGAPGSLRYAPRPRMGPDPWWVGVQADGPVNMVYAAATSAVAEGKLRVARSKNATLAPGLIVDKDGNPSTDPMDFYNGGALLPVGGDLSGHKGYGLSMASESFMLTRMREAYDWTVNPPRTFGLGLARTGKLITCSALVLMFAFFVLASGPGVDIKQFGIGLAAGIIFDATVIRALLVPALMRLLGKWNWWMPAAPSSSRARSSRRWRPFRTSRITCPGRLESKRGWFSPTRSQAMLSAPAATTPAAATHSETSGAMPAPTRPTAV